MRSSQDFETVRGLALSGMNDCAIARETGIPLAVYRKAAVARLDEFVGPEA